MYDWENSKVELTAELMSKVVELCLPNPMGFDEESYKKFLKIQERQKELCKFWLEKGFQPFPFPEQLVIVYRNKGKQIPKQLITVWNLMKGVYPVEVISAREVREKGEVRLKAVSKELTTKEMPIGGTILPSVSLSATGYDPKFHEEVERVYADEVATWFAAFIADQMNSWNSANLSKLSSLLRPEVRVEVNEEKESVVVVSKDNAEYCYDWSSRDWFGRTTQRQAMKLVKLGKQASSSSFVMMTLILQTAARRFNESVEGAVNDLPNLWERDPNYGVEWEHDHPTRMICEGSQLPIAFVERDGNQSLNVYPFILPINEKHRSSALKQTIAEEGDAVPDKYNIKFVAGSSAARAAGTAMVQLENGEWVKRSIHDQKGTKALNRPMQARKHLSAVSEIHHADGTVTERERSVFRTIL